MSRSKQPGFAGWIIVVGAAAGFLLGALVGIAPGLRTTITAQDLPPPK